MREREFDAYMASQGLAGSTRSTRISALKRIEKAQECDLDDEFSRDGLVSLLRTFTYTSEDKAVGRANPTRISIDPDKNLQFYVHWFRSHLRDYAKFCGGATGADEPRTDSDDAEEAIQEAIAQTFGLEKDLQAAVRSSLDQLEPGLLIADGGVEQRVEAGFIDILARDREGKNVIIELKAGPSKPESIAQVLSYMASISDTDKRPVRGYLIASEHPRRVELAAKLIPNLQLRTYRYRFQFD